MCFSLGWWQNLFVWLVIVAAIVAILQILLPYILKKIRPSGEVSEGIGILTQIARIVIWAVIVIFVIYVAFALISCLLSMGGGGLSLFPRGR